MKNEFNDLNKTFQFYNTPACTSKILVDLIDFDLNNKDILEPSAGQGGILNEVISRYPNNNYYFCEIIDYNREVLSEKYKNIKFICKDFLEIEKNTDKKFDLIIANPPFNKNQDIVHFSKMLDICKIGGYIISILSNKWRKQLKTKINKEFINKLNLHKVELIELNNGNFKDIGLNIECCILKLKKECIDNIFNENNYDFSYKEPEIEPTPIYVEDFEKAIVDYTMYEYWTNICLNNKELSEFEEIKNKKFRLEDIIYMLIKNNI